MTIRVPDQLEQRLRDLATEQGRPLEEVIEEAIRQYVNAADLPDVSPEALAETQEKLIPELTDLPPWSDEPDDATR